MDKQKKKKKIKKKIKREKKELIYSNNDQINETIAKQLLDKILMLSVRQSNVDKIYKCLIDLYLQYSTKIINSLISTYFIFNSEEPEQKNISKYSWNLKCDKLNTWIEIEEPKTSKFDRCEAKNINLVEFHEENVVNNEENDTPKNNIPDFFQKFKKVPKKFSIKNNLDILYEKSFMEMDEDVKDTNVNSRKKLKKISAFDKISKGDNSL